MKFWARLCLWLGLVAAVQAADGDRFSQWLTAAEQKEAGLEKLSSDQVAVLDALIRRDLTTRVAGQTEDSPAEFSKRLTADELRNTGIPTLTAAEQTYVDSFVARYASARLARTLLAPPVYIAKGRLVEPSEKKKGREIHGTFSLSMGWGSGGYSEQTGSMMLRMDDPEHKFSISVGYSESHIKGPDGGLYRDDYFPRYGPLP
jgi:hypothetical protein